jgi:hypothetical protein
MFGVTMHVVMWAPSRDFVTDGASNQIRLSSFPGLTRLEEGAKWTSN